MSHRVQGQLAFRAPEDTSPEITEVTHLVRAVPPPAPSQRRGLLGSTPPTRRPPPLPSYRAALAPSSTVPPAPPTSGLRPPAPSSMVPPAPPTSGLRPPAPSSTVPPAPTPAMYAARTGALPPTALFSTLPPPAVTPAFYGLPSISPPAPPAGMTAPAHESEQEEFALLLRRRRWSFAAVWPARAPRSTAQGRAPWALSMGVDRRPAWFNALVARGRRLLEALSALWGRTSRRALLTHVAVAAVAGFFGWVLGGEPLASTQTAVAPPAPILPTQRRVSLEPTVLTGTPSSPSRGSGADAASNIEQSGSTAAETKRLGRGAQGKSKNAVSAKSWRRAQRAQAAARAAAARSDDPE